MQQWPEQLVQMVALNAETGERRVFDKTSGIEADPVKTSNGRVVVGFADGSAKSLALEPPKPRLSPSPTVTPPCAIQMIRPVPRGDFRLGIEADVDEPELILRAVRCIVPSLEVLQSRRRRHRRQSTFAKRQR